MLQKWYQGKADRHTASQEMIKALKEAGLELYINEVLQVPKLNEKRDVNVNLANQGGTHEDINDGPDKGTQKEEFIRNNCRRIKKGDVDVYVPMLSVTYEDRTKLLRKEELGKLQPGREEKVIVIVGGTGSGKSTLINAMFNYIVGVEWTDNYRLKLIDLPKANQATSVTKWTTVYTIHHRPEFTIPFTLTIIDTPGFGDTDGIIKDRQITKQIQACFSSPKLGVDSLDAVGFVVQSALPRLTPSQRYIFNSILSLFGNDIGDNMIMLLTFADGQEPQALKGIKETKIHYKQYFKFNNSALFVSNKVGMEFDENFDETFWKMGRKRFIIFMAELQELQKKSLDLTKDVLQERSHLELIVERIQVDVKIGTNKLEQLRVEHQALDHHQFDILKNKDFTYTVDEQKIETEPTNPGEYTANCITCKVTCHKGSVYTNAAMCPQIMRNGSCTKCHCPWSKHKNQTYVYVTRTHRVTKIAEELKKCQEEFDNVHHKVLALVENARKSIERLSQIALRPNPLSTVDYIDILITSQKSEARPGWKERVEQLVAVKENAEQIQAIAKEGYDPLAAVRKEYDDERKQRQQMRLQQLNQ